MFRNRLIAVSLASLALAGSATAMRVGPSGSVDARVERLLKRSPVIDGHNDLPWELRQRFAGDFTRIDLERDTAHLNQTATDTPLMTDIPRLRAGHVGGQFWSVWIPPTTTGAAAIEMTVEQIDLVKRMIAAYPRDLAMAYDADDIVRSERSGRVASLIGIEGGHQIGGSLAALRQMFALGARYMTLTHTSTNDIADAATDNPRWGGLSPFGVEVVHEMNRLGMLVDLSHVSPDTMRDAIAESRAPVMFSHSGARALIDHPRDVPDDVLKLVAANHGIVMVTFYPPYISAARARWEADRAAEQTRYNAPPYDGLYIGQPERAKAALAAWDAAHPRPETPLGVVADHVEHVARVCGHDCVGIGSDFDGIGDSAVGLDGVDKFPALIAELARRGWTDRQLEMLTGGNILRVMRAAQAEAARERRERGFSWAGSSGISAAARVLVTELNRGDLVIGRTCRAIKHPRRAPPSRASA